MSCEPAKYLYYHKCYDTSCPDGSYLPAATTNAGVSQNICYDCDYSCETCEDYADECITCNTRDDFVDLTDGYITRCCETWQSLDPETKECVTYCPDGTMRDINAVCQLCDPNCKTCKDAVDTCTTCHPPMKLDLDFDECVAVCPDGTFANYDDRCEECDDECAKCEDESWHCTECSDGLHVLQGKFCIEQCDPGFVAISYVCEKCDPACAECETDHTTCTVCNEADMVVQDGTC